LLHACSVGTAIRAILFCGPLQRAGSVGFIGQLSRAGSLQGHPEVHALEQVSTPFSAPAVPASSAFLRAASCEPLQDPHLGSAFMQATKSGGSHGFVMSEPFHGTVNEACGYAFDGLYPQAAPVTHWIDSLANLVRISVRMPVRAMRNSRGQCNHAPGCPAAFPLSHYV
jgi:hypothetical protein